MEAGPCLPATTSLLLFWACRTLNYARKMVVAEFVTPVYCQAEEVGRAPHWAPLAMLTLAKINIRGSETFFLNVPSQSGTVSDA